MKKKLLSAIATGVAMALIVPAAAFAVSPTTIVTGTVTQSGNPVNGVTVDVTCNAHNGSDVTDALGGYEVDFAAALCPNGTTATAQVHDNGLNGSNSGPVVKQSSRINLAVVDVSVVPEMGVIAAATALAIGGGAFVVVRQRKLHNQA